MRRVTLSAAAGHGDRWGEELPLYPEAQTLALDMRQLGFAEPIFLLRLAALLDRQARLGRAVPVRPPSSGDVGNYLSRMNVNGTLPEGWALDLPQVRARHRPDALVPVSRLPDADAVDRLAAELAELLEANFTGPLSPLSDGVLTAMQELCDNATSHGNNPDGAYVAVQRYQRRRCVLAIGDLGVGIPRHIRRTHRQLTDDGVAIARATERGVTGTYEERGHGYQGLIRTFSRTEVPSARLRIWSGDGRFSLSVRNGRLLSRRAWTIGNYTVGTWINLELLSY